MTQSSDVQGNINKIIIVKVKFIMTFTVIYDDFSLYASDLKCLYKSRYFGEEVVKGMNNGYSGLFIPEDYSQFIDSTLYKLNDVYLRSMSKYEK